MTNQFEDHGPEDLKTKMNVAKAKGKDLDRENDEEEGDEGGKEDEFMEMLELQASQSLMTLYHSNPQCVNRQFLNPKLLKFEGGNQQRAWGKPQADESAPVPAGFEQVMMLGPVIMVCAKQAKPHDNALVVYRDGFAHRADGKQAQPWRFDEVAGIQTTLETHKMGGKREYKLTRTTGKSLVLDERMYGGVSKDDWVKLVEALEAAADQIKLAVFKLLTPLAVQRYEAGEALKFGPVTVQQKDGIQLGGHRYAWADVQNIALKDGRLKLTLNNGKRDEIRVPEIPNIELLARLIGVDVFTLENGMRAYI